MIQLLSILSRVFTFTFIFASEPAFQVYAFLRYSFICEWFCKEFQKYMLMLRNLFLVVKQIATGHVIHPLPLLSEL